MSTVHDEATNENKTNDLIDRFKANLESHKDDEAFARKFILHGSCFALDEQKHYDLKDDIASHFSLEASTDVFIVGSAKLGFSIAPSKRFRRFTDDSDIDVAIVNHEIYARVWHEIHRYKLSGGWWPKRESFESYLSWGWIRPDKLPRSRHFSFTNEWWDYFRSLQQRRVGGPYKVAGALYHDINFVVKYQSNAIKLCRLDGMEDA